MEDDIDIRILEEIFENNKEKLKYILAISINDFKEYLHFCEKISTEERFNLIHKHNIKLKNIGFNEIFLFFKSIEEQIDRKKPVSREQIEEARILLNIAIKKTETYIKLNF